MFLPSLLNIFCFCNVHTLSVLHCAHLFMKYSLGISKVVNAVDQQYSKHFGFRMFMHSKELRNWKAFVYMDYIYPDLPTRDENWVPHKDLELINLARWQNTRLIYRNLLHFFTSCHDQEGRRGPDVVALGTSVFSSSRTSVSRNFWGCIKGADTVSHFKTERGTSLET